MNEWNAQNDNRSRRKKKIFTVSDGEQAGHGRHGGHSDVGGGPGHGRKAHASVQDADEEERLEEGFRYGQQGPVRVIGRQAVCPFADLAPHQRQIAREHVEHGVAQGVQQLTHHQEERPADVLDRGLTAGGRIDVKVQRRNGDAGDLYFLAWVGWK